MRFVVALGFSFGAILAGGSAFAAPTTLQDAMIEAYHSNPTLLAEQANLRATDEDVPQALAGWRPTVTITGERGRDNGNEVRTQYGTTSTIGNNRNLYTAEVQLSQPIFRGGATRANTHRAKNTVYAERANLIATEEKVFAQGISDYVTVIEDQQLLDLNTNNQQVLAVQLKATQDRFRVGELTQTDVAQAQAALDGAIAQVATAQGNLASANAAYEHDIGSPPVDLVPPSMLALKVKDADEAGAIAAKNNPNVVAAEFTVAAARDNVDLQFSALLPQISALLQGTRTNDQAQTGLITNDAAALLSVTVPLYQGGAEYSKVRQAKEQVQQSEQKLIDERLSSRASAVQAYQTFVANQAAVDSDRAQVSADEIALAGVEREALVGTATTLDVLIEEQDLLQARTTLVQNLAQAVASSYGVASSMGRLTARDLALDVPLYDETAYYDSVDMKLFGVSVPDQAGGQR
jgi:outer membrane protein